MEGSGYEKNNKIGNAEDIEEFVRERGRTQVQQKEMRRDGTWMLRKDGEELKKKRQND